MGQLTFQATLGGAVNLVGPNTASTTSFTLPSADGTSGQALTTNGSGTLAFGTLAVGAGGTGVTTSTGSGSNVLSASPTFTGDVTLNAQGDLRFADSDSSNWVAFQAPATIASNVTWTLPATDGSSGQLLSTNGSGTLSWATGGSGSSQWTTSGSNIYYTTGSVGVGTTSPAVSFEVDKSSGEALRVAATGANQNIYSRYLGGSPSVADFYVGVDSAAGGITGVGAAGLMWQAGNAGLAFGTNNTLRMNINSAGQVGIGSTTAGQADRLYVYKDGQSSIPTALIYKTGGGAGGSSIPEYGLDVYSGSTQNNTTAIYALRTRSDNTSGLEGTTQYALYAEVTPRNNGSHYGAYIKGGHGNVDGSGTQTVAVIEGRVYGGTGTSGTIYALRLDGTSNYAKFYGLQINSAYTGGNTQYFQEFTRNGSVVGTITTTTSATAYNTSSDYRLKENVQPLTGALAKVQQLKPCTYTWKKDGSSGEGFIAHELAEVIPQAVTGEKDEVKIESYEVTPAVYRDITIPAVFDDNGNEVRPEQIEKEMVSPAVMGEREVPAYQGIDTSFLVATLTAAIKEQQTIIESLKARLDAANI